jgi:o-succinylbenzoate synthase
MLESALGQAASLALATLPNFTYPADIFSSDQFYQVDLAEPAIQLAGPSRIEANAEPSLGRVPNADLLTKMTIRKAVLRHE